MYAKRKGAKGGGDEGETQGGQGVCGWTWGGGRGQLVVTLNLCSRKHRLLDLQHTLNLIRSSVLRSFLSRKLSFAAELGRLATAEAHSSRKDGQKLSFHSFALVQEGLAIAMQQVGLKEEALQLYDKLQLKLEETPHSLFLCDTNDAEETAFVERSKRKLEWEETGPPELSPSMQKKISTRTISLVRLQAQFESSLAFSPLFDMTSLNSRLLLQTKTGTKAYFSKLSPFFFIFSM